MRTKLNINPQQTTFQDINTAMQGAKGDKQLRLTGQKLHVHDKIKTSGLGNKAAEKRKQKHLDAFNAVRDSIDRQLGTKGLGDRVLQSVLKPNRYNESRIKVKDLADVMQHVDLLENAKEAYTKYLPGGNQFNARAQELGIDPNRIDTERFTAIFLDKVTSGTPGVNTTLNDTFQELFHVRTATRQQQETTQWNNTANNRQQAITNFTTGTLGNLADNGTEWNVSRDGSGGVVFVRDPTGQQETVLLKFDMPGSLESVEKMYSLFDGIRAMDTPLPFDVPNHELLALPQGSNEHTGVQQKLNDIKTDVLAWQESEDKANVLRKLGGAGSFMGGGYLDRLQEDQPSVSKYEFMDGAQVINELSVNEKLDLLQSDDFGVNMGMTMVLGTFLGLNDHVGFGMESGLGFTNLSNLMLGDDGRIKLIDVSTVQTPILGDDGQFVFDDQDQVQNHLGFDQNTLAQQFSSAIAKIAEMTASPEDLSEAFEDLFAHVESNFPDTDSPLLSILREMFNPNVNDEGTFFTTAQSEALSNLDDSIKQTFAAKVMLGMVPGIPDARRQQGRSIPTGHADGRPDAQSRPAAECRSTGHRQHHDAKPDGPGGLHRPEQLRRGAVTARRSVRSIAAGRKRAFPGRRRRIRRRRSRSGRQSPASTETTAPPASRTAPLETAV